MSRYQDLQQLCSKYDEAAIEQTKIIMKLGRAIIVGFEEYLGSGPGAVYGVPPDDEFIPGRDYRERSFSFHGQETMFLEPVDMGLCVLIANLRGKGSTWVTTRVEMFVRGNQISISVGTDGNEILVSRDFEGRLGPVFAELYHDIEKQFSLEIDEFESRRSIGFLN